MELPAGVLATTSFYNSGNFSNSRGPHTLLLSIPFFDQLITHPL